MKYFKYKDLDEATPEDVDLSSFELKDELNKKFWIDDKLNRSVRIDLLKISRDFLENLEIEGISIEDIIFTGSLANYNWNEEYSDIDLHIVLDFKTIGNDEELVKKYFDAVRKNWNDKHDEIKILGYPVELYVQDIKEKHTSSGVYSILNDEWIEKPSKDKIKNDNIDDEKISVSAAELMTDIENLEAEFESTKDYWDLYIRADELFDKIKSIRKDNFTNGNKELSEGYLIFKTLRRNGYLERLIELKTKCYDKSRSIEK